MGTAAIDARGIQPLQADLDRIDAVHSVKDLAAALSRNSSELSKWLRARVRPMARRSGHVVLTGRQDSKNSKEVIVSISGGGISLPEREYYFKDDARSREIREQFLQHVAKMFELLGQRPRRAPLPPPRL